MSGGKSAAELAAELNRIFRATPFSQLKHALTAYQQVDEVNAHLGPLGEFLDELIDDRIVVDFSGTSNLAPDQDMVFHGRQGWADLWRTFIAPWRDFTVDDDRFEELDSTRALVIANWCLVGEESGIEIKTPMVGLWKVQDQRLIRLSQYDSIERARAEAALPEWQP